MKFRTVIAIALPLILGMGSAQAGGLDSYSNLVGNNATLNNWSDEEEKETLDSTSTSAWDDSSGSGTRGDHAVNLAQQSCDSQEGSYWRNGSCKTNYSYYCRKIGGTWKNGECLMNTTGAGAEDGGKYGWPVGKRVGGFYLKNRVPYVYASGSRVILRYHTSRKWKYIDVTNRASVSVDCRSLTGDRKDRNCLVSPAYAVYEDYYNAGGQDEFRGTFHMEWR